MRNRALLAVIAVMALAIGYVPSPLQLASASTVQRNILAYRGLGTWIDLYDAKAFAHPVVTVKAIAAHGVRTIYVETSNYSRPYNIYKPAAQSQIIETAHSLGMKVVSWYLPGFTNLARDLRGSLAAIRFRTPSGQHFDSFGLDIESSDLKPPSARSKALLHLSARIRNSVPPAYTMAAIIPSPFGMDLLNGYWPRFPYRGIAQYFDVIMPMSYSTYRAHGQQETYDYTVYNIQKIREYTGNAEIPIHVIGGIAGAMTQRETVGFVHAVRENGVIGAGLYGASVTSADSWAELANIPVNPRESPPLPEALPSAEELGNLPGGDQSHPKEVFYSVTGPAGSPTLSFEAFDAQTGELSVWVNWHEVADVAVTADTAWGAPQQVAVPAPLLDDTGPNVIQFVASGDWPDWSTWGVRNVMLTP